MPNRHSPIEKVWLIEQFQKLHKEHEFILSKLNKLEPQPVGPDSPITTELADAVKENMRLARSAEITLPDSPQ